MSKYSVLIIEDDEFVKNMLKQTLIGMWLKALCGPGGNTGDCYINKLPAD